MAINWTQENASQELANTWIHGIGFFLSIPSVVLLVYLARVYDPSLVGACLIYGVSLVLLYLFSTLSHAFRDQQQRYRFRCFDQGFIYILIVGTFTPFAWAYMEGWPRAGFLTSIWGVALTGLWLKVFAEHRVDNMAPLPYILLGWIPSMVLLAYVPIACFGTMAIGGMLYTFGTIFLINDHRRWWYHSVWHFMVIAASASHYIAIVLFPILKIK